MVVTRVVCLASLATALLAGAAAAKPLPKGLTFSIAKGAVVASRGGVSAPVLRRSYSLDKLTKAELSEDGKTVLLTAGGCGDMFGDSDVPEEVPLTQIDAALENVAGMKLQLKKKYADAVPHFRAAVTGAPDVPVYTTNLLSALSMGKQLDEADKVLTQAAKTMAPWLAWRLAVDSDLAALKGRPAAKLDAPKAGTAKGNLSGSLAYSPLGYVATEVEAGASDGMPDGTSDLELVVVSTATGKELLRLPTEHTCADAEMAEGMGMPVDKNCAKKEAAKTVKKRKVTDAILAQLGFDVLKGAYSGEHDAESFKASDGRTLTIKADKAILVVGGKAREIPWEYMVWASGWVPGAFIVVSRSKTALDCAGTGMYEFGLSVIPTL